MLFTIIAPEAILGKAWGDIADAKEDLKELQKFIEEDNVPWTITHALFTSMGGFVIRFNVDKLTNYVSDTATRTTNTEQGAEMQGQVVVQRSSNNTTTENIQNGQHQARHYNNPFHLNGS